MNNSDRIYYSRDGEERAAREMTKLTILSLVVGLGIGGTVALLFAPASGKKMQHDLAKTLEDRLQNGQEAVLPMVKRLEKDFADLRKSVEDRVPRMK